MKRSSIVFSIEMFVSFIIFLLNIFVFKFTNTYIWVIYLAVLSLVNYFLVGYEKPNFRNKKDIFLNILFILLIYFIVTYLFGFIIGFTRSGYNLNIISILKNIFPYLLVIVIREFYRYLYFTKTKESKLFLVLGFLFFILLDINLNIHTYDISNFLGFMKMLNLVVFPSITKNILLIYLVRTSGYMNTIFYSCVMELKQFILPIFPNFGEYIDTIINMIFPLIIMFNIMRKLDFLGQRRIESSRYYNKNIIFYAIITVLLIIIVVLTSGNFKYYALTIGSGSMTDTINKGDVVIVKKISSKDINKLRNNKDILVYKHDNKIIVHRLVQTKNINGITIYITKGDNNLTKDSYYVKEKDIIGTVAFRIRYIGLPTVSLNERLED